MDITENANLSEGKQKALEVAEDAREKDWKFPSFVAELFQGKLRWDLILPYPEQDPEDIKEGDAFLAKLEKVLDEHVDPELVDQTGDVPESAIKALAEMGAFAIKIPKEYDGLGMSQRNYNRALHLVASHCSSTAVWLSAHQSIGVPQPLMVFGTEEQKKKYLPRFRKGAISAFALTEPEVGSDPAKMSTTATLTEDGKHYLISGDKLWCTNGPVADILVVMAQTAPKMIKGKERKQISAFIVEKDMPGFEVVHRCQFMGLKGIQNGLLRFTNVKVPKENIILEEGKGLKIALTTLNTGRLTMPAAVTGGSKWCLRVARDWANERVQWGAPVGKHEAIAHKISSMAATVFAMDAVTMFAASMADSKRADIRLEAAMAKLCCTEASWHIIDGAVQIRGGRGYETATSIRARGEKAAGVERMFRDARINTIIEGTSQIMRLFIAREAMDIHMNMILPIMSKKTEKGAKWTAIKKALKFYTLWYPKQFVYVNSLPEGLDIPKSIKGHMKFAGRASHKLARNLFLAMGLFQQKLEGKQQLMARLVNIGSDIFAISATCSYALSRYQNNPNDSSPFELADLFCRQAKGRIKKHFRYLFSNSDKFAYDLAQDVLAGKYDRIEKDIMLPKNK